jgi:hypothetical protein
MGCLAKLNKFSAVGNPLVSPPMDVIEQSLDAMRTYLSSRMNGTGVNAKKKGWLPRQLMKYNTFSARTSMTPGRKSVHDNSEGFLMSDYRSLNGSGSPGFLSMLSPRRFFSPRRDSLNGGGSPGFISMLSPRRLFSPRRDSPKRH